MASSGAGCSSVAGSPFSAEVQLLYQQPRGTRRAPFPLETGTNLPSSASFPKLVVVVLLDLPEDMYNGSNAGQRFFLCLFPFAEGERNKITPSLAIWPRGPKPGGAGEPHSPSPPVLRPEPERFLARSFGSEHLFSLLSCYSVIFPPFLPCYRRITPPALSRPRGPGRGSLPSFGETRALFGGGLRTASPALRGGADSPSPREEKLSRLAFPSPCEQSHPSPSLPDSRAVISPVPAPHG